MEAGDELEAVAVIADDDRDEHALHLDRAGERLDVRGIERANVVADANVDERDVAWCLAGCRRHQALPSGCGPPPWRSHRPQHLISLSSTMHRSGQASLADIDWLGSGSYSDSKLLVTTLAMAVARLWPDVLVSAVDPGWVPTRMGGAGAPDDLRLGHLTQEWLV